MVMKFLARLFGGGDGNKVEAAAAKPEKVDRPAASKVKAGRAASLQDLEGFVEYVAKSLVDYPDEVKICSESTDNGKMIKIICRAGDRGKIIGKKGKTIMALRALVAGAAGRMQDRISVEVPDEVDGAEKD